MDILDRGLEISNYIDNKDSNEPIDLSKEIEAAIEWSIDANRVLIIPTGDINDLEDQWSKFNQMPKQSRRISDWKSLELFGCTNKDTYEKCRAAALSMDTDDTNINSFDDEDHGIPLSESAVDLYYADTYYDTDIMNYSMADVDKARLWGEESDRAIIIPTRTIEELEELWDSYNAMVKKHRRESDWMSLEIFGVTNLKHYEYLKNQFLKKDIEIPSSYGYVVESADSFARRYFNSLRNNDSIYMAQAMLEMARSSKNFYEETITNNVLSDVLDKCDSGSVYNTGDLLPHSDMPFFDPDTMIDMGVFSSNPEENYFDAISDNILLDDAITVKEWFELYKEADKGFYTGFYEYASAWVNKVRTLMFELSRLKNSGDSKAIPSKKQSILELGWNPDVEFSNKARVVANETAYNRINSTGTNTRVIDLSNYRAPNISLVKEVASNKDLKPVYVVLVEGKSYFSKAIKMITRDIFSHSAISLDPSLKEMYSYGIAINDHSDRAGFRRESIEDLPIGGRLRLFVFFVSKTVYKKIEDFINGFKANAEKTSYSYVNLLTYLFNIPYNKDWSLICSQFVDRCLKAAGIDVSNKDSSTVSPHDLNVALKEERRIYTLYQGLASKYDATRIKNLVDALSNRAKPIKESNIVYIDESRYVSDIISNINNIPVLLEMKNNIDVVKNQMTRRIIESVVFDAITVKEYIPNCNENSYYTMDSINKTINKYMTSI